MSLLAIVIRIYVIAEDGSVEFERKKRGHVPLVLRQTERKFLNFILF